VGQSQGHTSVTSTQSPVCFRLKGNLGFHCISLVHVNCIVRSFQGPCVYTGCVFEGKSNYFNVFQCMTHIDSGLRVITTPSVCTHGF